MKGTKTLLKKKKKEWEKRPGTDTKIFLKKKKTKKHQYHDRNEKLSKEEKQKKVECMRNHYSAHKK